MILKAMIAAAAAGGVLLSASPALAGDRGLYGAGDPTYDGVYRQSLSLLALKATGGKVPARAVRWLRDQQCPDGGFMAYRNGPCLAPDPVNYAGEDSNSTAVAAAALWHAGEKPRARKAAKWLKGVRGTDSGWSYYPAAGAGSDSTSTALALAALEVTGRTTRKVERTATGYLKGLQQRCRAKAAVRGGLLFDATTPGVNDNATAQVAWALGGGLALADPLPRRSESGLVCKGARKDAASVPLAARPYLTTRLLASNGALQYGGGYEGTDYAGTAAATMALAGAGVDRTAVRKGVKALAKAAPGWITASGGDSPGSLALLTLVARTTGEDPRDFAGINLPARLAKTLQ